MFNFKKALTLGLGMMLGFRLIRRSRRAGFSFRDKVVMITGGSRGLGLVMARKLADEGADLVLLARNGEQLERARQELLERGAYVMAIPCDVSDQRRVETAVREAVTRLGRLDVVINNAGVMQVGPLEHMTIEDFREAIDVHIFGPLHTTLAALPFMRRQGGGRIVNISSIGGKIAAPHLLPYVASKHGLVGLSDGLRAELRKDGIYVTTVCPGLMRTGSPRNALFKGRHRKEYAWFAISDSLPVLAKNADRAARDILEACRRGKGSLTITPQAKLVSALDELFPELVADLLAAVNRLLPRPIPGTNGIAYHGYESVSIVAPSPLTSLGDKAAKKNNE